MALAMQGLCSGDFCGMSGINWVQGQTEGGDPRCYEAEEPRSALPKVSLAHVSMAKCCKMEEHHLQMVYSPGPGFGLIGIPQHPDALRLLLR